MIYLEIPLWLAIVFAVWFILITLHLLVGDLFAKLVYKIMKDEEKRDEAEKWAN